MYLNGAGFFRAASQQDTANGLCRTPLWGRGLLWRIHGASRLSDTKSAPPYRRTTMPAKTETAWLIERDDIAALRLAQIIPNSDPVETAGEVEIGED